MSCSTFSRSGWSIVRSASLAKGGTSKKRLSPHIHKVPTRSNKVSPRTLQTAPVIWECKYRLNRGVTGEGAIRRYRDQSRLQSCWKTFIVIAGDLRASNEQLDLIFCLQHGNEALQSSSRCNVSAVKNRTLLLRLNCVVKAREIKSIPYVTVRVSAMLLYWSRNLPNWILFIGWMVGN